MSDLNHLRSLEVRLHSQALEWDDQPLLDELLYLLDELQQIHAELDQRGIPDTGVDHIELGLRQRVSYLAAQVGHSTHEQRRDFYGATCSTDLVQARLF